MDTRPIKESQMRKGAKPNGQLHEDFMAEIRQSKIDRRVPKVAKALDIDEKKARELVIALIG